MLEVVTYDYSTASVSILLKSSSKNMGNKINKKDLQSFLDMIKN